MLSLYLASLTTDKVAMSLEEYLEAEDAIFASFPGLTVGTHEAEISDLVGDGFKPLMLSFLEPSKVRTAYMETTLRSWNWTGHLRGNSLQNHGRG